MENISNELRLKIMAAYIPCLCVYSDKDKGSYAMQGVSLSEGMAMFEWDDDSDWWNVTEQTKLILSPLPSITDEHAVEVVKMCGWNASEDGALNECFFDSDNRLCLNFTLNTYRVVLTIEIIDYLRSVGYDCGYGNIPSLIDVGIAISKTV